MLGQGLGTGRGSPVPTKDFLLGSATCPPIPISALSDTQQRVSGVLLEFPWP